jgi:hypothetical protein
MPRPPMRYTTPRHPAHSSYTPRPSTFHTPYVASRSGGDSNDPNDPNRGNHGRPVDTPMVMAIMAHLSALVATTPTVTHTDHHHLLLHHKCVDHLLQVPHQVAMDLLQVHLLQVLLLTALHQDRHQDRHQDLHPPGPPPSPPTGAGGSGLPPRQHFTCKPNLAVYKEFKDTADYSAWIVSTIAALRAHGLGLLVEHDYRPAENDPFVMEDWWSKQAFGYMMLDQRVLPTTGRRIIQNPNPSFHR